MKSLKNFAIIKIRNNSWCGPLDYMKPNFKNRFILEEFDEEGNNKILKSCNMFILSNILQKSYKLL
jgi:hypothetical protein